MASEGRAKTMRISRLVGSVLVTCALALCCALSGLGVCLLPPVTRALSRTYALEDLSPLNREQLAQVADAIRDFSFGSHDELALQQTVYAVDVEYRASLPESAILPASFPDLDAVADISDLTQLRAVFARAGEQWCLPADAIAHLDDCYEVLLSALPVLMGAIIMVAVGLAILGWAGGRRLVGTVLLVAGALVVAAFVALGLWALVDFDSLFTSFHQVFFSQGNWLFAYDCLMICALPTEFWMGMGAIWLVVSLAVSLSCMAAGFVLRRHA